MSLIFSNTKSFFWFRYRNILSDNFKNKWVVITRSAFLLNEHAFVIKKKIDKKVNFLKFSTLFAIKYACTTVKYQFINEKIVSRSGANGTYFFVLLAFPYFSTELVRSGLIKKSKNCTSLLYFFKLMQQYRKKFFKIIEFKKWGVLPILVGYFGPCISNENTLPSYTYQ